MKIKYLLTFCLIMVFLMSITGVSAMDDINKTEDLGISQDSNLNEYPEIFNATNSELNVKENSNLNENIESNSNILSMSNDDILTENNIIPTNFTFAAIQTAVDNANNGDTITLKEGTYLNNGNGQISISKNISFVGVKGKSILDAQKTSRIFYITAQSINITDIIFMNGLATDYGGAIYFKSPISNSNINGTYINNTAKQYSGGANYFNNAVSSSNITGTYINNTANGHGGANNFHGEVSNSNIGGTYNNNTANQNGGANNFYSAVYSSNITGTYNNNTANINGGANYFYEEVSNSNITGTYNNNTANSIIYFDNNPGVELNSSISNSIFLNNNANHAIYVRTGNVTASNNWFGNNASNYNEKPKTYNVEMPNWLFLNATANPNTLSINETSDILFKLYSTDGSNVSDFDNTQIPVINLTLTSTHGNINPNNTALDENVEYTATTHGTGSITAKVENAEHTIYLKNIGKNAELSVTTQNITYTENETIILSYNNTATGKVNITLKSKNYNKTIQKDINDTILITDLPADEYNVTVEYNGDEIFYNATANTSFIVKKLTTEITTNTTMDLFVDAESKINYTIKPADAVGNIVFSSNNTNIIMVDSTGNLKAKSKGSATITVHFSGSENYTPSNATITVTVNLNNASVTAENMTLNVGENDTIKYTTNPEGLNVTFMSDNSGIVSVNQQGIVTALKNGTATITVSVGDSEKYAINKTVITVTVTLNDANVTAKDIELKAGENGTIEYTTTPEGLNVSFTPDDTSVISVNDNGTITAIKAGTAQITITVGDNKKYTINTTTITVTVTLNDANVTAKNIELTVGENGTIEYTTNPTDLNVSFVPDDSGIVKVSDNGTVTALKTGTANITITVGDNKKYTINTTTITVTVTLNDASITAKDIELTIGENSTIEYTTTPEGLNVSFTPDDSGIVKVSDNGTVTALKTGIANITITVGDNKKYTINTTTITVTVTLNDASITAKDIELTIGENGTIEYTTNPTDLNVSFVPDDSGIVKVSDNGTVTALKAGTAQVTITVGDGKKYAINSTVVIVTVNKIPTEILIQNKTLDMKIDDIADPVVSLMPSNAGNLSFKVSDTNVILVNGHGSVMAVGEGNATVTISFEGNDKYLPSNATITVTVSLKDASVVADRDSLDLLVGEEGKFYTETTPEDLDIEVSSSNESVATVKLVNRVPTVTAVGEGTAVITVTINEDKYVKNSTTVTVTVVKRPTEILIQNTTLDMKVDDIADPVVSLMPSNAGNLSFKVSDTNIILVNGHGSVMAIGEGTATVTVSFDGNDKYLPSNATITVTVSKVAFEPEIDMANSTLTVAVPENATGNVTLTIGNETFAAPIKDGVASFDLSDVPSGNYNATVTYPCDDKYAGFDVVYPVSIEGDFIITAEDLTKYYHGPERFAVNLTDNKGNPIANANISISINSKNYTRTTNDKGQAFMTINLNAGEYPVVVTYNGTSVDATVTVLPTVNGTDIIKVFRNGTQYYATFRDSEGNYLKDGETVRFNIHGVMYDRKVSGDKGLARLNINLEASEYIITAMNSITGDKTANNITVLSRLIENADLVKYFRNASQYTVKVIGDDGKAVGTGENVTFNINGVFYTHQTNTNSIAKLNINLQPSDYIITAEYKGCLVSNNIKVLPTLNATDITMKYRDGTQFKATLVDGQGKPYVGQNVTFNINGVFYNRPTDSTGTAKLNINLMPGEYIITSSHNGSSIANKITITG